MKNERTISYKLIFKTFSRFLRQLKNGLKRGKAFNFPWGSQKSFRFRYYWYRCLFRPITHFEHKNSLDNVIWSRCFANKFFKTACELKNLSFSKQSTIFLNYDKFAIDIHITSTLTCARVDKLDEKALISQFLIS